MKSPLQRSYVNMQAFCQVSEDVCFVQNKSFSQLIRDQFILHLIHIVRIPLGQIFASTESNVSHSKQHLLYIYVGKCAIYKSLIIKKMYYGQSDTKYLILNQPVYNFMRGQQNSDCERKTLHQTLVKLYLKGPVKIMNLGLKLIFQLDNLKPSEILTNVLTKRLTLFKGNATTY